MELSNSFKKYLLYSISFHALVLILLLLFGSTPLPPPIPTTQVTMIRLSRGSGTPSGSLFPKPPAAPKPAVTQAPPPPAPPIPVAKPAPIEPVTPVAKPTKPAAQPENPQAVHLGKEKPKPTAAKPTANAPAKPTVPQAKPPSPDEQKMNEALNGIQNDLKQREAASAPSSSGASGNPSGGSPVPPFGSTGEVTAADPGYAQYQSSVRSKIIREWVRASSTPDGEQAIRTRIQVRINASGAVISKNVVRSSGNESFDLSALRAIERASPLPPPPEGIKTEALSEGFVVDFSSRMLGRR